MFSILRYFLISALLAQGAIGCVGSSANSGSNVHVPAAKYREVEVDRLVVSPTEALTAFELLERGKAALAQGRPEAAVRDLERIITADARGPWTEEALFFAARAHEESGDHARAAERFERLGREYPRGELAREALLRAMRLLVFLEAWQSAGLVAEHFRTVYAERLPREELVVSSALALAILDESGESEQSRAQANALLAGARRVIERYQLDAAGSIPRDLAQVYYAMAELRRIEAEQLDFDPLPASFPDAFERRARLLLDAQSAYSNVMRAYDAHWTAMAGFRVGELYQSLHQDVMSAPRPPGLDTERRRLIFEAALRLRYSVLLEKGLKMIDHTLAMADRTGERSQWVQRARATRAMLADSLAREQAAVEASPYTRQDIERVLAELSRRGAK